ncbi:MAG: hypothetical protein MUC44_08685 [Beijerinckiaceae bacterium]|nr:hypothetical protein [Beijerinckiaceae bacterium]
MSQHPAKPAMAPPVSLMRMSAGLRMVLVGILVGLIWLAVAWAIAAP